MEKRVSMLGLPNGRMLCKTCEKRFLFARELVQHIIETRNQENSSAYNEGDADGEGIKE